MENDPSRSRSPSLVLRPEEKVRGDSSKMVSIGGPLFPVLLRVVLVGMESKIVSLWLSVLYSPIDRCSLSDSTVDMVVSDWVAEGRRAAFGALDAPFV